jgi:hypothetical protein
MGGGGSGPRRIGNIDSLIDKAKQELRAGAAGAKRNVFLSFAYEDVNLVNLLRGQARNENVPLEFNDWSVSEPINSERAIYIKEKISDRIAHSSVTVVFLSDSARTSEWVDWEVRESLRQGKHVIGVFPKGAAPREPTAFKEHRLKSVPWPDLAAAIDRLS